MNEGDLRSVFGGADMLLFEVSFMDRFQGDGLHRYLCSHAIHTDTHCKRLPLPDAEPPDQNTALQITHRDSLVEHRERLLG